MEFILRVVWASGRTRLLEVVALVCVLSSAACVGDGGPAPGEKSLDGGIADVGPAPDVPFVAASLPAPDPTECAQQHTRASAATASLVLNYWTEQYAYFVGNYPYAVWPAPPPPAADYASFLYAANAFFDAYERTKGRAFAGWIDGLVQAQIVRGGFAGELNDQASLGVITLLRAAEILQEDSYSYMAQEIFDQVIIDTAWDDKCCDRNMGGIWWNNRGGTDEPMQKTTSANALAIIAAVALYEHTGDPSYLEFGEKVYDYWYERAVDKRTFAVLQAIEQSGTVNETRTTQNQGLMIGASLALHESTGNGAYLAHAQGYARYLLTELTKESAYGPVLADYGCRGRCGLYKADAYRYLLALHRLSPRPEYRKVLEASAAAVWYASRDPRTGVFQAEWTGPAQDYSTLAQDGAAAVALNLATQLDGCPPPPADVSYQAEDAELQGGIGIEARVGRFEGWGYTGGWDTSGRLTFRGYAPRSGEATLWMRYSADGDTTRRVLINGTVAANAHPFPSTGAWDAYSVATLHVRVSAGWNIVEIGWQTGESFVNFDEFRILADEYCEPSHVPTPLPFQPQDAQVLCLEPAEDAREVSVCWENAPGATTSTVYMDGARKCDGADGCCVLEGVREGQHEWIVDGHPETCRSSLSAPQTFTVLKRPVEPALLAPAHGAVLHASEVDLTWTATQDADRYEVWVDDVIACSVVGGTSCRPPTLAPGVHLWRVVARNDCGHAAAPVRALVVVE